MKNHDASWITKLKEMYPNPGDDFKVRMKKDDEMVEYVDTQSDGALALERSSHWKIYQLKPLPWSYLFDLLKNMSGRSYLEPSSCFVVMVKWPANFTPIRPEPEPDRMYAKYDREKDAIMLTVMTGECIEHRGDEDGFGEEPDEHRTLVGFRDRDGKWIEEPRLTWI